MSRVNPRSARLTSSVQLEITARTGQRYVPFVRRGLMGAFGILRPRLRELSVALVGDSTMSGLHQQFMGISGPTDVLTFPLESDSGGGVLSGEIVVCVSHALRQARLRGIDARCELLLYALHGTLHLAGFDDKTASGFRRMHRKEDEILTALGIGPVFVPSPAAHPPAKWPRPRGAS